MQLHSRDRLECGVGLGGPEADVEQVQATVLGQRARDAVGAHRLTGAQHRSVGGDEQVSHCAAPLAVDRASIAAAISSRRRSHEWDAAARERSARRSGLSVGERFVEQLRYALRVGCGGDLGDVGKRG